MYLTSTLSFLMIASTLASAAPAASSPFKIQTKAISGPNSDYDGLYLYPYHTGAGFNVPTFAAGGGKAPLFHLNGTKLLTDLSGEEYGLAFGEVEDLYALWGATTLDIDSGNTGFSVKNNHIVNTNKKFTFFGWRVCEWVHGVPELYFNTEQGTSESVIPKNCELVDLVPVYKLPPKN